jgi:HEPN domain-containing protein
MKFAETLFEIARSDLEASKCLFGRELYPQAVFYLQQSIEKATKSFGLLNDVIKEDELKHVSHNPLKVYKKSIEKQKKKIEKITDAIEKVPKLGEAKIIKDLNFRNYHKKIAESLTWFGSLDEVKEEILFIQKSELRFVIQELDNLESELESELESLKGVTINSNEELLKVTLEESKKASMEILEAFYEFSPQKIEKGKEDLNIKLDLNLMKVVIRAIQLALIVKYVTYSLYYLSLIMFPHAIVTRYPDNNHNPLKMYNKNLPLIQLFCDMVEIMEKTLSKLENLLTATFSSMRLPYHFTNILFIRENRSFLIQQ